MKNSLQPIVSYTQCNREECKTLSIKGDNIIVPVLFGIAIGVLIAKRY